MSCKGHQVQGVALVQKGTSVDLLLGTDLMAPLGIKVFDADGEFLLNTQSPKACQAAKSDLTELPQLSERIPYDQEDKHAYRQPCECRKVGRRRQALSNAPKFPSTTVVPPKAVVRLIRAYNLPAHTGKLLKV